MGRPYTGVIGQVSIVDGVPADDAQKPQDVQAWAQSLAGYMRRHGLAIVDDVLVVVDPDEPTPVDSRTLGDGQVVAEGTRLRDAAVNPKPGDFLPPTNAGHADPHGPLVVSPELHGAEGAKPLVPGDVGAPSEQQVDETGAVVEATTVELERPPASGAGSGKDAWITYAISKGADPDEVGLLTRDALIEAYGSDEADES